MIKARFHCLKIQPTTLDDGTLATFVHFQPVTKQATDEATPCDGLRLIVEGDVPFEVGADYVASFAGAVRRPAPNKKGG